MMSYDRKAAETALSTFKHLYEKCFMTRNMENIVKN